MPVRFNKVVGTRIHFLVDTFIAMAHAEVDEAREAARILEVDAVWDFSRSHPKDRGIECQRRPTRP